MSTRQPSLLRKAISVLASFALVFAFVPIAWAEGENVYIFVDGIQGDSTIEYKIGDGDYQTVPVQSKLKVETKSEVTFKVTPVSPAQLKESNPLEIFMRGPNRPKLDSASYTTDMSSHYASFKIDGDTEYDFECHFVERSASGETGENNGGNQPPQTANTTIALDNNKPEGASCGVYNDSYKEQFGTINYSTDYNRETGTGTWKDLDSIEPDSRGEYVIESQTVWIKIEYSTSAINNKLQARIPGGSDLKNNTAVLFNGSHIEFSDNGGGEEILKPYQAYYYTDNSGIPTYETSDSSKIEATFTLADMDGNQIPANSENGADFAVNDSNMMGLGASNISNDSFTYHPRSEGDNTEVDFYFSTLFVYTYERIEINNEKYVVNGVVGETNTKDRATMLKRFYRQTSYFKLTVPKADNNHYEIKVKRVVANSDELFIGNFLWANKTEEGLAKEDIINGGRIELLKAVDKDGTVLYDPSTSVNSCKENSSCDWNDEQGRWGSAVFPEGTVLTVKLIPDYGKQLVGFYNNGVEATPLIGSGASEGEPDYGEYTYRFTVKKGNFHLGAKFEAVGNLANVANNVTGVSSPTITVPENRESDPVPTGTLMMDVAGTTASAENANAVAAVDITMTNVKNAANASEADKGAWNSAVTELGSEVTVGLKVDGVEYGDQVEVIREHEVPSAEDPEATTTHTDTLTATVTADGTVQFNTDKFSKYTIVMVKKGSNTPSSGGGSSVPAPSEPEKSPISNAGSVDSASATVDVTDKVTTTETGSTQVAVDADLGSKIVENAVANNVTDVVIKAETTTGSSSASTVALPASTVRELAEKTEASVTISTDSAQVTLDKAAVAAVAEQAGEAGSVQLVVQTSEQNKNKVQIEVTLQTSNGNVSDFRGGSVTISVPVSEELAAKKIVCVYIDENGKYTKMPGALSEDGKSYVFSTGHFSTYAVMTEEEANAAIAEQEKAEAAALAAAKPAAPSVKLSSPAKGKLTVKASTKKAKGYRVYYKKAGWKAYKTYTTTGTVKTLNKTLKKLSKGSYTVKVRAFGKTAAGKIAWGAKSKAKKVAVK